MTDRRKMRKFFLTKRLRRPIFTIPTGKGGNMWSGLKIPVLSMQNWI